jgi:hypothetical protein
MFFGNGGDFLGSENSLVDKWKEGTEQGPTQLERFYAFVVGRDVVRLK